MSVDLLTEFAANIKARQLLEPHDKVLAAVSSGPDSIALLHLLWRAQVAPLGVFHLNHMLRPEAEEEACFVAAYAKELGLSFMRINMTSMLTPGRTESLWKPLPGSALPPA